MQTARITNLGDLDGLSIKDAARMPHCTLLATWRDQGLYTIDVELGVFRLTPKGKAVGRQS